MRLMKLHYLLIACFTSLASCQLLDTKTIDPNKEKQIQAGKNIFLNGIGDLPPCASCHLSDASGDPILVAAMLAGLSSDYIFLQLNNFADKVRVDDKMFAMNNTASILTTEQRKQVAAYIGTLPKLKKTTVNEEKLRKYRYRIGDRNRGALLYQQAQAGNNTCKSCHGENGQGSAKGPRLRYQQYTYLVKTLDGWRSKSPATVNRSDVMTEAASVLSAQDIEDLSAYLAYGD